MNVQDAKDKAGQAAGQAKDAASSWSQAHPNAGANAKAGAQNWASGHQDAINKGKSAVNKAQTGVHNWFEDHPDAVPNAKKGVQDWRAAHPDVTIQSLIDQIVAYMTPERRQKAKDLLTTIVELLMDKAEEMHLGEKVGNFMHNAQGGGAAQPAAAGK